jgi:hypothetical protein
MSHELKIKAKSLAAESRMIRQEEIKLKRSAQWNREHQNTADAASFDKTRKSLYEHRTFDVRREARTTNIARAYLSGKTYRQVEPHTRPNSYETGYMTGRVQKLVKKYGTGASGEEIAAWLAE